MLRAAQPRSLRLDERGCGPEIESPPATASLAGVVARAPASTATAAVPLPAVEPDIDHHPGGLHPNAFDRRLLDAQQASPYTGFPHAVPSTKPCPTKTYGIVFGGGVPSVQAGVRPTHGKCRRPDIDIADMRT